MTAEEWVRKMSECKSPLGRRVLFAMLACDEKATADVRKTALCSALECNEAELIEAIKALEAVGLAEFQWIN